MEWHRPGLLVCLTLVILPSTIKWGRSFLLAPAHPGGPRKRAVKWLWYSPHTCMHTWTLNGSAWKTWLQAIAFISLLYCHHCKLNPCHVTLTNPFRLLSRYSLQSFAIKFNLSTYLTFICSMPVDNFNCLTMTSFAPLFLSSFTTFYAYMLACI